MQIYIHHDNQQLGPFTEEEIKAQLASGAISLQDHVWWQGQANWVPLGESPLAASLASAEPGSAPAIPSPIPGAPTAPAPVGTAQTTSQLAIWALVCGFVGLLCAPAQILAIILGHLGLSEIKKKPNLKGRSMAITALIVGYAWLTIVIACVVISVLIALGNTVKATTNTISSQVDAAATNSDQPAATPDQTTPAPASTPDQSTNTPAATPSDSTTNAAPMTQ